MTEYLSEKTRKSLSTKIFMKKKLENLAFKEVI